MSDNKKRSPYIAPVENPRQNLINDLLQVHSEASGKRLTEVEIDEQKMKTLAVLKKHEQLANDEVQQFRQFELDIEALKGFVDGGQRSLDQLLVSEEPWPFESVEQLEERFGSLPDGYCYRYLAYALGKEFNKEFQLADNVVRLPTILSEEIDDRYHRAGDEIPDHPTLESWLSNKPADVKRQWALRILANTGIMKDENGLSGKPTGGSVPGAGRKYVEPILPEGAENDPTVSALVKEFVEQAIFHYDAEEQEDQVAALGGVAAKHHTVQELAAIRPWRRSALRPLLDHDDLGVRVSAATYLLKSIPQIALPVLREIAFSDKYAGRKHAQGAAAHAAQTIWMYEDGNLNV